LRKSRIASIIGSGINGNFTLPGKLARLLAKSSLLLLEVELMETPGNGRYVQSSSPAESLLLLEVELMETFANGANGEISVILIASIIGSGINGN